MKQFLLISQIIVSVLLVIFILFQQRGTALGSAFGGGGGGGGGSEFYGTKRGIQKKIFSGTIVLGVLFVLLALLNLILS